MSPFGKVGTWRCNILFKKYNAPNWEHFLFVMGVKPAIVIRKKNNIK